MLIHKFVLAIFCGPRANEMGGRGPRIRPNGRGSRNTNTQLFKQNKKYWVYQKTRSVDPNEILLRP